MRFPHPTTRSTLACLSHSHNIRSLRFPYTLPMRLSTRRMRSRLWAACPPRRRCLHGVRQSLHGVAESVRHSHKSRDRRAKDATLARDAITSLQRRTRWSVGTWHSPIRVGSLRWRSSFSASRSVSRSSDGMILATSRACRTCGISSWLRLSRRP